MDIDRESKLFFTYTERERERERKRERENTRIFSDSQAKVEEDQAGIFGDEL